MSTVQCELCPRMCRIAPGKAGCCRIRVNLDGKLTAVTYGRPVAVHVDPMEKKPLFHFLPGSPIFSVGTVGCNLRCLHCQNWEISQANPEEREAYQLPPDRLARLARAKGCEAVAYTYTEPVAWYEYAYDSAVACRKLGLKNVLVTAAYANPEPLARLLEVVDGVILDVKAMSDEHYREICGGTLEPVLEAMRICHRSGVWLEVLNLIVPTLNDKPELLDALIEFVRDELSPDVPLHFTAFRPAYKLMNLPPTPASTLLQARQRALQAGLHHVYVGNVTGGTAECTFCPGCGRMVVRRVGYRVLDDQLGPNGGVCPGCGRVVAGIWS